MIDQTLGLDLLNLLRNHTPNNIQLITKKGNPIGSSYSASKFALHGFFDGLRAEVSGDGIGVRMICPGFKEIDLRLDFEINPFFLIFSLISLFFYQNRPCSE